jgi:hypothetical protein
MDISCVHAHAFLVAAAWALDSDDQHCPFAVMSKTAAAFTEAEASRAIRVS